MPNKQDSNLTGLRIAEEASLKTLGGSPVWYGLEPNGYSDFGGQITTVARNPINPSRQRKKGAVTDMDASGGFGTDLVIRQLTRFLQGFFFADLRQKPSTAPMNGTALALTTTTTTTYTAATGLTIFSSGDLVLGSGFALAANNGVKLLSAAAAGSVTTTGLAVETPPAAAKLEKVGVQFGAAELDITAPGGGVLPRLSRSSGTKDFTTMGLVPGEWVFVGGDAAGEKFSTATNNGFCRIKSIGAAYLEFDKTAGVMASEVGTGKTIRLFFGNVLKNESTPSLIKRRSFQLERTLGDDGVGTQSEYVIGAIANEFSMKVPSADKVTCDLSFVGLDVEQRTGTQGVKAGTRPTTFTGDAINTSSDFSRIKLAAVSNTDAAPLPLVGFLTDLSLSINNNVKPKKAIGTLGAFDTTAGTFEVEGSLTAYFSDVAAVQAVRANADVTLDFAMVKSNMGMVFDIPLLSLGDGRADVQADEAIMLPLSQMGAESSFGHTLMLVEFPYLPAAADL